MKRQRFEADGVLVEIREEINTLTVRTTSAELVQGLARGKQPLPYRKEKEICWRILRNGHLAGIARRNGTNFVCGRHSAPTIRGLASKLCGVGDANGGERTARSC